VKAWWLGFPVFRCPHCGKNIELGPRKGIRFVGRFKLPRVKRESGVPDQSGVGENVTRSHVAAAKSRPRVKKEKEVKDDESR